MPPVPAGGLILVTGASGYIAGVLIQVLLDQGYSVRGTVRSATRHQWMLKHYGPKFTLVEVPDMAADNAFDEAVKGVDGIAHTATAADMKLDPNEVIVPVVKGISNILTAAAKEPSVKSVVYTSSSDAVHFAPPGTPYTVTADSWNDASVERAWAPSTDEGMERRFDIYAASKTSAERAGFKWVEENKPHFTFNTVIPTHNFGTVASPINTGFSSTAAVLRSVFNGNPVVPMVVPPHFYIDTEDTALLHIAALTQPDVQNERIFGYAGKFTWHQVVDIFRKLYPERKFLEDFQEPPADQGTVDPKVFSRAEELLQRFGKPGFGSLEDALRKGAEKVVEMEGKNVPMTAATEMAAQLTRMVAAQS